MRTGWWWLRDPGAEGDRARGISPDGLTDRVSDLEEAFVKVTGEVDGYRLTITNAAITTDAIIDGPYIDGLSMAYTNVTVNNSTHTITYTFRTNDADDAAAYILIWK